MGRGDAPSTVCLSPVQGQGEGEGEEAGVGCLCQLALMVMEESEAGKDGYEGLRLVWVSALGGLGGKA